MEASALTRRSVAGLGGPSPLLRLQSDERLIALTRRGQHAAFETLCARYQSRLLSFCRHMLGSREDAEDVLQDVFAAAFNAVLADEREINARPWLYRIARNRSLNHLRRASAVGVDSMDVHFADHGLSTGDRVIRRESFRELLADVRQLPETQHTALLLREIDALSYEQIAQAMDTTVPSVKSLLVRARISLAEAAEARNLSCAEVRLELGEVAEGLTKLGIPARRHVRGCERCRFFKRQLKDNNHALAAMLPVGPLLLAKKLLLAKLGSTASAGGAHVAGGAGATMGAGAAAGAATGGAGVTGGIFTAGAGALGAKAVAGLAAAAMVTAGAVAVEHTTPARHQAATPVSSSEPAEHLASRPMVIGERPQPQSTGAGRAAAERTVAHHARHPQLPPAAKIAHATAPATPGATHTPPQAVAVSSSKPPSARPPVVEVTTETTQLPSAQGQPTTPSPSSAGGAAAQPSGAEAPPGEEPGREPVPSPPAPAEPPPLPAAANEPPPAPAHGKEPPPAPPTPQPAGGSGQPAAPSTPQQPAGDGGQPAAALVTGA